MDNSVTQATLDTGHRANKITKKNTVKKGNNIITRATPNNRR
jgi:hypothetical protein